MVKKFRCPYCYEKHSETECRYTCSFKIPNSSKTCVNDFKKNPDGTIPIEHLKTCLKCNSAKLNRICPLSNQEIPDRALDNTFSLALLGAKESGKSNYIAVLINEIKRKLCLNMNCSLISCNEQTSKMYQNTYYKPLYENKTAVQGTDKRNGIIPLIYSLFFYDKHDKITDSMTISLYDTAGENLDTEAGMLQNNQYISNSDGIIVLLDPLQIPSVREKLQGKVRLPAKNTDTNDILSRIINIIRAKRKIKGNIKIPIALVFTKMDVLAKYDVLPEYSSLREESQHVARGGLIKSDFENTKLEINKLLENFFVDEIVQDLKQFDNYAFFGVSSFGEDPENGVKLSNQPHPIRVLDPLIWLLADSKYIKTYNK